MSRESNPPPIPNDRKPVWDLVIEDMRARNMDGVRKYGTPLQSFNGRDALRDAYEEALDLAVYLRQVIEERDNLPQNQQFRALLDECAYCGHSKAMHTRKCRATIGADVRGKTRCECIAFLPKLNLK